MASKEKKTNELPAETRKGRDIPAKSDDSTKGEFIKRFKAQPFIVGGTIVILVIVVVAFVFVPAIVPAESRGMDLNFGSYNKTPITFEQGNYFNQVYQSLAQDYQSGLDENNYQMTMYQILRGSFEAAVVYTAVLDEMKRAGYQAPPEVVDKVVAQQPQFQENGRFSPARYRQMGDNERMTLWRQVRDSLTAQYYIGDISGLRSSSRETAFIEAMASPERTFEMVSFPITSYPDSEIAAYARDNPALFRITHLSKITAASEREAGQILASVRAGTETFEDAAKNKSVDSYAENSGDMGSRMVYELLSEIPDEPAREQVVALAAGSLSEVVKVSDTTWAFFRVEEAVRNADTADAAVMEKIRNYILTYERGRAEDWAITRAEQFIAAARETGFSSAAADRVMTAQQFGPMPLNYGNATFFTPLPSTIPELGYAAQNEGFWQACFSTPLNTPSAPVVIGNSVVVIQPLTETPADGEQTGLIESYYDSWWNMAWGWWTMTFGDDLRAYFINSEKLDDRFWDGFQYFIQ